MDEVLGSGALIRLAAAAVGGADVKVAVITAVGVVLAAALTAWATLRRPDRPSPLALDTHATDFLAELVRRAESAERLLQQCQHELGELRAQQMHLIELLLRHDIDPWTGEALPSDG